MDTMTSTKVVAGLAGAFLVFLLGKWMAESVYYMDGHEEASYVIETVAEEATEEADEVSFDELLAAADAAKGEKVFKKCQACHKVDPGVNITGPTLYGVVGRDIASVDGFGYSGALAGLEGNWTAERLSDFLASPSGFASGTTMGFSGLKKIGDRVNLIAYLDGLGG